ncbi:hypothetical protein ASPCAL12104 [Aspergillus calidoustus]|uniref:Uncharacterized protein n=1 Tax=Aspergillus calidoustus TaxID=454130 RepID=A0A0U5GB16_ASPCI|nr:hypothetical protein ASPCAL12104 [Aspergillus calidoustus]
MGLRAWLYRKGFRTNDDIKHLEAIGGSFATAMFMLLISLPRGGNPNSVKVPQSKGTRQGGPGLCPNKLWQVRELHEELEKAWRRETDIEKPGQQVPLDRDEPPERCQSFSDHKLDITVDIYELEEMIAAKERDDLEKIGISVTSSRSGKLQLEVTRVALPTVNSNQQNGKLIKEGLAPQVVQTPFSLLGGRLYKRYNQKTEVYGPGLATWVLRARGIKL